MSTPSLTIADLERWVLSGAHWRLVEISKECAVVEMCACTGEPMERVETDDPTMIDYLRTADSRGGRGLTVSRRSHRNERRSLLARWGCARLGT